MGDRRLNELLRWGIQNTDTTAAAAEHGDAAPASQAADTPQKSDLTPELLAALMGGPSDADLMKASIEIINDPEVTLENKLISFDNFEQLIENLDNANNIANLNLWDPLLAQLHSPEAEMRKMAAWCVGTAVQNNERTQEKLLAVGGVPPLVELALREGEQEDVRRKAIYALSSAVRNYQPSMDLCAQELRDKGHPVDQVDASDMAQVDVVMTALREKIRIAN